MATTRQTRASAERARGGRPVRGLALCAMLLACACSDGGGGPEALFELSVLTPAGDPALDFFALPYPNDLRLDADGTPALARFPRPDAILSTYVDVVDATGHGFGVSGAVYLRFDASLDPATLPDPAGTLAEDSAVFLLDVTPGSAHRGERIPLRVRYTERHLDFIGDHWLALQPFPGILPREAAVYAAVVTDAVRGPSGAARPSPALARVLGGAPEGELETRAATAYAPLRAWLTEHPSLVGHVAHASVYTTSTIAPRMDALRQAVWATPAPALEGLSYLRSTALYDLYTASYQAPNFQEGDSPYTMSGGMIHVDAKGMPVPVRTESMRVALSVPKGPMPVAGWPLVLYAHGTGGNYLSFVDGGTATALAQVNAKDGSELARFAVISIDQAIHGPRAPAGTDVEIAFFNFNNLAAARDNPRQGALDDFQLLRLAKIIDVAAAPTSGQPIRFDAQKLYFFGHSQGSLTGGIYVGAEPELKAVVLSGAGTGLIGSLLYKTAPVNVSGLIQALFRDPLDEFHPALNLLQAYFDESDPGTYARRYFEEPPAGFAPKSTYVSLGLRDSYTPVPTIEAFALASGVVPVRPELRPIDGLELTGRKFVDAPQVGNVAGGATGVLCEYDPGSRDGHFVVFNVPAALAQSTRFLATHAQGGQSRLDPP